MTGILDRDPLLRELADLRDRVDDLEETVRQLQAAMTPIAAYPVSWRLTALESRLLHVLARAKGGALSKERLLVCLYGFEVDVEIKIIDVLICKIRSKVRAYGISIKTYWGQGYGLTLESLPVIRESVIVGAPAPEIANPRAAA